MFSKINHVAIVSEYYAQLAQFYIAAFGMKTSDKTRPGRAVTVRDGYVGLNINPRRAGRSAGLDHFGIQVEDTETCFERMRQKYPTVKWLKRPSTRPFAGISTHDPDGNIFDLSQRDMENRTSVYVEDEKPAARHITHFALRTLHPEQLADFYAELGLRPVKGKNGNFHLSDGRVTLVLMPWRIADYEGTGITRPGPDHFGFVVDNLQSFRERLVELGDVNPHLRARTFDGKEGEARMKLFERCCPLGTHRFADVDGVLLDVAEKDAR